MATIGSLSVKLGLVTVTWDQATEKAKRQAKDLQNAFNNLGKELNVVQKVFGSFAGSFNLTGIGLTALATRAVTLSREIQDMADSFGISTGKVLEYRSALEMAGVDSENTGKVLASVYNKIAEAQDGLNVKLINTLDKMGISLKELVGLKPEDALKRIAQGLNTVDDAFAKSRYAQELLGKSGKTFGVEAFLTALDQVNGKYYEQEKSIARLAKLDDELKISMQNLALAFGDLISKFTGNGSFIISIDAFKYALEALGSVILIKTIYSTVTALGDLYNVVKKLEDITVTGLGVAPWLERLFVIATDPRVLAVLALFHSSKLNEGEMGQLDIALAKGKVKVGDQGQLIDVEKQKADADKIENAKRLAELNEKLYGQLNAQITLESQKIDFEKRSTAIKLDAYNVSERTTKQRELELKYEQDIAKLKVDQARESKGKEGHELELINQLYQKRRELAKQVYDDEVALAQKQYEIQTNFVAGWKNAYGEYMRESQNAGERAAEAFKSMAQSLEDTLTTFFETGKLNFKSFAQTIIHEIARMQAQAAAKSIMGLFGGGGGFLSSLTSLFTGGGDAGLFTGSTGEMGGSILIGKRASGGDINANSPYMVGEHGPELIIPNQSGTVIPNNKMNQMMGQQNQPQIVYNGPYIANMSAIDTQSGLQFLAKNKQGVWAANQSAQRSIPQSR